jgi:homoserine kinase type II
VSVFTELTPGDVRTILAGYEVGDLLDWSGVPGGTDNTNYFVVTSRGSFVLTLLERIDDKASDFAAALAQHLFKNDIPCAPPLKQRDGTAFTTLKEKRVVLAPRLAGASRLEPSTEECAQVGDVLARIHTVAQKFDLTRPNPYGYEWLKDAREKLSALLSSSQRSLFDAQLQELAQLKPTPASQIIHGDLFRDNVLFDAGRISGVIDLYFACNEHWLLDLAITVNDWCWRNEVFDLSKFTALSGAYRALRSFNKYERQCWPLFLRYAALRFWASRLIDQHFPRSGQHVTSKSAKHMEDLLSYHRQQSAPQLP